MGQAIISVPFSETVEAGSFFVILVVDGQQQQVESNEANQSLNVEVQLTLPPLPDLIAQSIATADTLQSGDSFVLDWEIANQGEVNTSGEWVERVYYSNNADGTDRQFLASFTRSEELPNDGSALSRSETIDLPEFGLNGDVYFVVEVDADQELLETNEANTFVSPLFNIPEELTLSIDGDAVAEGGDRISATVSRNGSVDVPIVVTLTMSVDNQLDLPATVVIPAGQYSSRFSIRAVDDDLSLIHI